MGQISFSSARDMVDRATVHRWLSEESHWAVGRTRETQDAAIDASLNYGAYVASTGEQLAYARLVTDGVTFGWLCDVFVDARSRGRGIGRLLMHGVIADVDRMGLNRTILTTDDAQKLYSENGFHPVDADSRWMLRKASAPTGS